MTAPTRSVSIDDFDLTELWRALWAGKWLIVLITGVVVAAAAAYCLFATEWYRADVVLAPTSNVSREGTAAGLLGQFGGLASLAGISLGSGDSNEPLAVLSSRDFTLAFINDLNLLPVLFADKWNMQAGRWKGQDRDEWPDERDGFKFFDAKVRRVARNKDTGLVTLTIEWTDPDLAAQWANLLVKRLNDRMRQRALEQAESNIAYLRGELGRTNLVSLQQSIGRVLETEFQKRMLAQGNEEFSFTVIDSARSAKKPSKPRRLLLMAVAVTAGGMLSIFVALLRYAALRTRQGVRSD